MLLTNYINVNGVLILCKKNYDTAFQNYFRYIKKYNLKNFFQYIII